MNSIKTKLTMVLLLMAIIPLIVLGTIIYAQTTNIFTDTIQEFLMTIARTKDDVLENYIDSTETIGLSLATSQPVQAYVALTNKELNSAENTQLITLKAQVEDLLYSVQEAHWGKYHHIFIIDRSQKIVISPNHGAQVKGSPSSHLNEDTSNNEWAMRALSQGETAVSDYSSWIESDHSHQMLFYPIKDASGATLAVIGFELQIPYEQEILTENVDLGETGKIFLTTIEGIPIVYQGIGAQEPLNTAGIIEANETGMSVGRRSNADGVDVIDVYLKNAKYPWILVAEIEAQEAFSNLYSIQIVMLVGLIVTLVLLGILSTIIANYIVNPIKHLTKQMEQVSLGKLDIQVDNMDRNDEIGQLVQAFNRIVTSLKLAMKAYQKK